MAAMIPAIHPWFRLRPDESEDTITRMSTVEEIKAAIEHLDESQAAELTHWLLHRNDDGWDLKRAGDGGAGKLDEVIRRGKKAAQSGRVRAGPGRGAPPPFEAQK